jgi:hypothetical protein
VLLELTDDGEAEAPLVAEHDPEHRDRQQAGFVGDEVRPDESRDGRGEEQDALEVVGDPVRRTAAPSANPTGTENPTATTTPTDAAALTTSRPITVSGVTT